MTLLPRPVIVSLCFALSGILRCSGAAAQRPSVEKRCPEDCLVNRLSVPYQLSSGQAGMGGYLWPDECMVSPNKAYKFCFQTDGNIVMYNEANKPTWSSNSAGASKGMASALSMSIYGRLVAWNGTEARLDSYWESPIPSNDREGPFDGILQNDGNFVIIRRSDKKVLWSTSPDVKKVCPGDCLLNDLSVPYQLSSVEDRDFLWPDQCMVSQNKAYKLCYQKDGNIVLYNKADKPTWSADAAGAGGGKAFLLSISTDGWLVAYNGSEGSDWYWESPIPSMEPEGPFDGILQDDGNFVIIRRNDTKVMWSTSSVAKPVCPKDCQPSPGREFRDRLVTHPTGTIGTRLLPGECLVSPNGKYSFCFEGDGNTVVYSQDSPLWKSNTTTQLPINLYINDITGQLAAQKDDSDYSIFWKNIEDEHAPESGAPFTAVIKDDGNFVVTRGDGAVIWSTNTTATDEPVPSPPSPQPDIPAESTKPKGMSIGMIIGIVAGAVLGLAALSAGIFFLMKRRRSSKAQSSSQPSGPGKAAAQVPYVKADVEMGKADQIGSTPGKVALVR